MNQNYIAAVRKDKLVGRGTCSSIDECYDDAELWDLISEAKDEKDAIKIARMSEGLWLEQACNCRWGEDDDPELEQLRRFREEDK